MNIYLFIHSYIIFILNTMYKTYHIMRSRMIIPRISGVKVTEIGFYVLVIFSDKFQGSNVATFSPADVIGFNWIVAVASSVIHLARMFQL